MSASLFDLFCREVVPAHMVEVDLWAGRARDAYFAALDAHAGGAADAEERERYARGCRAAVVAAEREAKAAFRKAWPSHRATR